MLSLAEPAPVVLQLALQLCDSRRRLLVFLLEDLKIEKKRKVNEDIKSVLLALISGHLTLNN